jgi:anaphase-promoting complex subunit 1
LNLATRKMLCLHIPSLLPHTISEYDHAPCVQNAAVIGIGLLYMGTVHRLMAEFLIGEVGRRPANDRGCVDRESYGKYSKRRCEQCSCNSR